VPTIEELVAFDIHALLANPFVYFGVFDLGLMLFLILGEMSLYPVVRFRCALGIGFLGILFWCQGDQPDIVPIVAMTAGSIGLYLSTIFVSYIALALVSGIGLVGMSAFAYYMLIG
jgi:hypothetical protein